MALQLVQLPIPSRHCQNLHFFTPSSSATRIPPSTSTSLPIFRLKLSPFAVSCTAQAAPELLEAPSKTRLIAQNVPWDYTVFDIRDLFEKYGTVVDCELSMYSKTKNRGLAFVTMSSEQEAISALNSLNSSELDGRIIKVEFSRSPRKIHRRKPPASITKYYVFVQNLTWKVRSRDLREFFSASGNVVSAEVIFQSKPRKSAGYGFVSFSSKQEVEAAIAALHGKELMGRPVRLVPGKVVEDATETESLVTELVEEASTG